MKNIVDGSAIERTAHVNLKKFEIVVAAAVVVMSLAAYMWYLTPGKRDRL